MKRRTFLSAAAGLAGTAFLRTGRAASGHVVIVGGGWSGLAAAHRLRQLLPAIDITLIERHPLFRLRPLSNRWLVGLGRLPSLDYRYDLTARQHGYRFLQAEVLEIDRTQRRIVTPGESLRYDWLILAAGIRENFSGWFDGDLAATAFTREHYPSAFADFDGIEKLRSKLANFRGGDLVMCIPPAPYRCPPAPYERAGMIAWSLRQRQIKGRLIVLDPNPPAMSFDKVFRDTYRNEISYFPQARIKAIDPYSKRIETEFEQIDFADAILMPPQQAADIVWQADLIARDAQGRPTGWGAIDPLRLHAPGDERVFLVGDLIDKASPLFGHYPKTGQLAARLGQIAAAQIAAQSAGSAASTALPDSACYVLNRVEPMEMAQIETSYRLRGDGLIQQSVRQHYYPQADDEDIRWATGMLGELGLTAAG